MRQLTLRKLLSVLAAGILAVSCSGIREMYPAMPGSDSILQTDSITFSAYIGQDSRTQLGESMDVRWSDGDKVRVFTADNPQGTEFNLVDGAGTTRGVFVGPAVGEGPYYAVYPSRKIPFPISGGNDRGRPHRQPSVFSILCRRQLRAGRRHFGRNGRPAGRSPFP